MLTYKCVLCAERTPRGQSALNDTFIVKLSATQQFPVKFAWNPTFPIILARCESNTSHSPCELFTFSYCHFHTVSPQSSAPRLFPFVFHQKAAPCDKCKWCLTKCGSRWNVNSPLAWRVRADVKLEVCMDSGSHTSTQVCLSLYRLVERNLLGKKAASAHTLRWG